MAKQKKPAPRRPDFKGKKTQTTSGASQSRADKPRSSHYIEIPKGHRVVMGTHAILEAILAHPKSCRELWMKAGWESNQDLKKIETELRPQRVAPKVLPDASIDRFGSHQGAILLVEGTPEADWTELERARQSIILLLDGIEDPHNLGAILRTSWLMGVRCVLIPQERAVGLTATVHKVACGGAEHVPVEAVTNFSNKIEELKKQGYWVFGLSHKAKQGLFAQKMPEKVVWCIGAEDKGLRSTTERLCDELVSIPQVSAAASYNASVATAIALTETIRQRAKSP